MVLATQFHDFHFDDTSNGFSMILDRFRFADTSKWFLIIFENPKYGFEKSSKIIDFKAFLMGSETPDRPFRIPYKQ